MRKSEIDVSIIERSFIVYSFSFGTYTGTLKHKWNILSSSSRHIPCTVQCVIKLLTRKLIAEHVFEWCLYDYLIGRSIRGNCEQKCNTHFYCGDECCDGGYAYIFPCTCQMMFDRYYGHAELWSFYVSNIRLTISLELTFFALWIWLFEFF